MRNRTNAARREIKRTRQNLQDIDYDFYGSENNVWKPLMYQILFEISNWKTVGNKSSEIDICINYFKELYTNTGNITQSHTKHKEKIRSLQMIK